MPRPTRLAALLVAFSAAAAHGGGGPFRVGVITQKDDAEAAETARAFAECLVAADGSRPALVEQTAGASEAEIGQALGMLRDARVDLVVALGDAATLRVRDSVRDVPVVFGPADAAAAAELRRGGFACVAAGLPPADVVADLRRLAPSLRRVGVVVPDGDAAAAANAAALADAAEIVVAHAEGDTPEARAAAAAETLLGSADAVWLPPSISSADAAAVCAALAGHAIPVVGSRQRHLDAGCAVVVRPDPHGLGAQAAVLARGVLAGADPGKEAPRRVHRRIVEVNLPAARRLSFRVPLTLLAWADRIVRVRTVPR
jgi:ABC-type uncharacterized transport system substrate-binding protein